MKALSGVNLIMKCVAWCQVNMLPNHLSVLATLFFCFFFSNKKTPFLKFPFLHPLVLKMKSGGLMSDWQLWGNLESSDLHLCLITSSKHHNLPCNHIATVGHSTGSLLSSSSRWLLTETKGWHYRYNCALILCLRI